MKDPQIAHNKKLIVWNASDSFKIKNSDVIENYVDANLSVHEYL